MLSDLAHVNGILGIPTGDFSQQQKISLCLTAADAAVKSYCKRIFESAIYVEYPTRLGGRDIALRETPVLCYNLTGTLTSGQPTVAGISSTANLLVGMPAIVSVSSGNSSYQTALPSGTTIQSIDTSTQVTLSQNATVSLTGSITFGLAVWYDPQGSFGDGPGCGPNGFPSTTQLFLGLDYNLVRDLPDGTSKSGVLKRRRGAFASAGAFGDWGWGYGGMGLGQGTLTAPMEPYWPREPPGCVQIIYAGGYGPAAPAAGAGNLPTTTTIPADLTAAVTMLSCWLYNNGERGGLQAVSESYEDYSVSAGYLLKTQDDLGTVRQILSRYRPGPSI